MLPLTSLITTNEGTRVKVKQGKEVSEIEIQLGSDNGKQAEIVSGILEGEVVLTEDTSLGDKKKGGSLFMPTGGGRRGGKK
jgi:multidrug efflux pump subunit AcrA (membrane-fusion protein)